MVLQSSDEAWGTSGVTELPKLMPASSMAFDYPITETPADYHQIISPSLLISPATIIPVGLLACQRMFLRLWHHISSVDLPPFPFR
jgi:hypothetical protein